MQKKSFEGNEPQFVDLQDGKCFGKQKLKKNSKLEGFQGICKHDCRIKDACISASREQQDFVIDQNTNLSYDARKDSHNGEDEMEEKLFSGEMLYDKLFSEEERDREDLPEYLTPLMYEFVHRFVGLYFQNPIVFDALVKKLFRNMNISDMAREKGVTRQAVSATLTREILNMEQPRRDIKEELRGLERDVYILCFEDGCSIRSAAKQLGKSKDEIFRLRQKLTSKLSKSATVKTTKIKKNQKIFKQKGTPKK